MKKQLLTLSLLIFSFSLFAQTNATPEFKVEIKTDSAKNSGQIETYHAIKLPGENNNLTQQGESRTGNTAVPQKIAEHAPDINDPDYAAKKEEWIKNYPDEYQQLLNPLPDLKEDRNK